MRLKIWKNASNVGIGAEKSMRVKQDDEREIDPKRRIMFRQIGAKIAYYRTLRDLSQKELAKRINMSASTICHCHYYLT